MTEYNLQAFASDTIASQILSTDGAGTTFTLGGGNFDDTPAGQNTVLTLEPLVSAKKEIISCTISGSTVTIVARGLNGTSAVQHEINASVIVSFTPTHYDSIKAGAALALVNGWQSPAETWTYGSASSITVPAGATAKYAVGDKLKLNQAVALTSYWSFDTNSTDAKGAATMADIGTPTYTAGKFSNALTLNGTNQALSITDAAAFKPTGAFTIGCWIKTSTSERTIYQSYSDNTNSNGIQLSIVSNHLVVYSGNNAAAATTVIAGTTSVVDGNWHYVVWAVNGNFSKVFLDGALESSGYFATPTYAATNYVRIGCANETGSNVNWFSGQIDDLFFINGQALSEAWVAAKYAAATAQGTGDVTMTKYFYVTAVADTALTITGGADFLWSNITVTDNYYSKTVSPVGFPGKFNWIPTWYKADTTTPLTTVTLEHSTFHITGQTVYGTIRGTSIGDPAGTSIGATPPVTPEAVTSTRNIGTGVALSNGSYLMHFSQFGGASTQIAFYLSSIAAWHTSGNLISGNFSYDLKK